MQDLASSEMEMDALAARVEALEARVFGFGGGDGDVRRRRKAQSAAEALAAAHAVLRSATTGRDKIASVMHRRFGELNRCLSVATAGDAVGIGPGVAATAAALWPLILCEEENVHAATFQLNRISELMQKLDPRPLARVAELRPRLQDLVATIADNRIRAQRLNEEVILLKEQQKTALNNITQGLALLEAQVSRLEVAAKPRKVLD